MNERLSRALDFARSRGWSFFASALVIAFAYSLCRRAINLTDEGYLLSQVVDMLEGKVLYRDMDAFVTPGIWFFLAGLFKLIEPSVLASRILSFAGYLGTLWACYRIVARLAGRAWGWSTIALLMVFTVWAFPAWTMLFYSPIAILFALAALERLLSWREDQRGRDLLLCGFFLGISILCKQNYGVFAAVGTLGALAGFRLEDREPIGDALRGIFANSVRIALGACVIALPTLAYFGLNGALGAAFDSLVIHPFVFMSRQDIPYPSLSMLWAATPLANVDALTYGAYSFSQAPNPFFSMNPVLGWLHYVRFLERLHVLLFWLPPIGLAAGAFVALRRSGSRRSIDGNLLAVLAVAGFVYLGVFPRADFNHLINVYQPAIVAFVLVVHRLARAFPRPRKLVMRAGFSLGLALLILYAGIAGSWYLHTLSALKFPVGTPRGGVLVSSVEQQMIDFQVRMIREKTRDGEFVLTVPALTMFNFLADRRMPGRYYNLYEHHIAHDDGAGVVEASEAHNVDFVVSDYNNFFSDRVGLRAYAPKLATYLRTHFEPDIDIAGDRFRYLKRRETPVAARSGFDLIDNCDLSPDSSTYSRNHLLFASLYQARNLKKPNEPVITECTFTVPHRGQLSVSIGYRRPIAVKRNTTLTAEIWLADGENSEPLLLKVIPVRPQKGWSSPPAPEYQLDLGKFAGREITLLFRTIFNGRAKMGALDLGGFALVWQDLRIEARQDRVLLVGIDGATFRVIRPLMAAGKLPNLQSLAREGIQGPLRSAFPLVSPRIWTTMATGKVPLKHGIHHWIRPSEDGGTQLNLSTDRLVPALWNITTSHGLTSGVVNWLNTYPPEKVQGVLISDFAIAGQREDRERLFAGNLKAKGHVDEDVTYPADWSAILDELTTDGQPLLDHENPFGNNTQLPSWLKQDIPANSFRDDDLVTRIALEIEERVHPDVLLVYLSGIDKVSHNAWGALEPPESYPPHIRFSEAERAATIAALESYYVYTDKLIGKLLERYGPNDLVMIVSDHGFEAQLLVQWLTGGHEGPKAINGVIFARGSGIPHKQMAHRPGIADITPTILAWLGLPVGADMDGHVAKFLDMDAVATVPSYNDIPIERVADDREDIEDSIMDQLRGLGYVE